MPEVVAGTIALRHVGTCPETEDTPGTRPAATSPTNKVVVRVTFLVLPLLLRHGCWSDGILDEALVIDAMERFASAANDLTKAPVVPPTAVGRLVTCDDRKPRSYWREEATLPWRMRLATILSDIN